MEDKKVLLKVEDLNVKFRVRGRILTAIRGISLDIYEGESIAIVGESGSGKSVFTKTFAGMLDSNGFIDQGRLIFNDEELADTVVVYDDKAKKKVSEINAKLDELSKYEFGAATYKKMLELADVSLLPESDDKRGKDIETDRLRELFSEEEIDSYIATGSPMDKAGAYGIQDKGFLPAKSIKGDYFNVVGLPAARLKREAEKFLLMLR